MATKADKRALTILAVTALVLGALPLLVIVMFSGSVLFLILLALFYGSAGCALIFWNRGSKKVFVPLALIGLVVVILIGNLTYEHSLASVKERFYLGDYAPFQRDSKTARLEQEASLQTFKTLPVAELPRLNGATALYPVYASFVWALYPEIPEEPNLYSPYEGNDIMRCSGTSDAYDRLLRGDTDIIFCARPSKSQLEEAAAGGREFVLTPIGREAFVVLAHRENPVHDISEEALRGIYSGRIKNWKELGGKNQPIRAFQRPENSGSQTILQSVMGETPLIKPRMEDVPSGMGGMIRQVAAYRNFNNAIGYSFLFFATVMSPDDDIQILSANGIVPSGENIRNGTYPFSDMFYAVTLDPANPEDSVEPEDPAARVRRENAQALIGWILSGEGQTLIEKSGYIPL
ncbi:MAG: substrate-binding domain-containing protein [Spirochaetaceae bacterium]|jgi:phosphate transport system substrate-binding protein|nr:substrate-binding domain-containing protein [Spirochaetaceae bacterium]